MTKKAYLFVSIGELSKTTGCNIETIRYYERIGILPKPNRNGRYRVYGAEDAARLTFVRRARSLGFTLGEIRTLLIISKQSELSCDEARNIAAAHLLSIRSRLRDLRRMERVLTETVRACEADNHVGCPLIDTLSIR